VSLKLTQRQLDALREDAIEEGRSKERQEQTARSMERSFKRTHVLPPQAPVFTTIGDLKPGTIILSTDDGRQSRPSLMMVRRFETERSGRSSSSSMAAPADRASRSPTEFSSSPVQDS
jgi:hypothetical protein